MLRDGPGQIFSYYHDQLEFLKLTGCILAIGGCLYFVLLSIIYISVHLTFDSVASLYTKFHAVYIYTNLMYGEMY